MGSRWNKNGQMMTIIETAWQVHGGSWCKYLFFWVNLKINIIKNYIIKGHCYYWSIIWLLKLFTRNILLAKQQNCLLCPFPNLRCQNNLNKQPGVMEETLVLGQNLEGFGKPVWPSWASDSLSVKQEVCTNSEVCNISRVGIDNGNRMGQSRWEESIY